MKQTKTPRAVVVARVSTVEQASDGKASIPEQLRIGRARAAVDGWQVVNEYTEPGVSGAKELADRPVIQRLLRDATAGKFEIAIWSKLDRLSRKVQTGLTLIEALQAQGIRVVIHDPAIDTKTAMGQFGVTMLLAVSELERGMIAERMMMGVVARLKDDPSWWPGGRVAVGWKQGPGGLVEDKPAAKVIRTMFERVANGETTGQVARWLDARGFPPPAGREWRHATVARILSNPAYASGAVRHTIKEDGSVFNIKVPVLVDQDLFDRAQIMLHKRREYQGHGKRQDNPSYPLSARAHHDHEDGTRYLLWAKSRPYYQRKRVNGQSERVGKPRMIREYRCETSLRPGVSCDGMGITKRGQMQTAVIADKLEAMVLLTVLPIVLDRSTYLAALGVQQVDLEGGHARELLEERVRDLGAKRKRTVEAFVDGLLDKAERDRRLAVVDDDLAHARHELEELGGASIDPDAVMTRIRSLIAGDLSASNVTRFRKRAGDDPDKAVGLVLESVLDEAKNLGDGGELSFIAQAVLSSIVDRLGVQVEIGRDWQRPRISLGGVVIPGCSPSAKVGETMRMSSNYSQ